MTHLVVSNTCKCAAAGYRIARFSASTSSQHLSVIIHLELELCSLWITLLVFTCFPNFLEVQFELGAQTTTKIIPECLEHIDTACPKLEKAAFPLAGFIDENWFALVVHYLSNSTRVDIGFEGWLIANAAHAFARTGKVWNSVCCPLQASM
ncbi:hypothetical protein EON65_27510 [archaeon]|nr:MAG: hypothetical protein EON65_27510 [archaeon]